MPFDSLILFDFFNILFLSQRLAPALSFQRAAFMNLGQILICMHAASCIRRIYGACLDFRAALVVLHEILERILLTGILLDTFHDRLTADGAIIRNVIVHATGLFRTEYATAVHKSTFVDIYPVAVTIIEYQVTPRHFVHFACQ